jgi:hypothetical protein
MVYNSELAVKKKRRRPNLPVGVNERDLEMFTHSQAVAKEFLIRENGEMIVRLPVKRTDTDPSEDQIDHPPFSDPEPGIPCKIFFLLLIWKN